jgi:hypothetical protein
VELAPALGWKHRTKELTVSPFEIMALVGLLLVIGIKFAWEV